MPKQTSLYRQHVQLDAHMVDFCGWQMPLHYGSQLQEHSHVRSSAGMFDVSHMRVIDLEGGDAFYYLRYLLANDVLKLSQDGQALYTCMLNETGGVVDDLIAYRIGEEHYRLVVNACSHARVIEWLYKHIERYVVEVIERSDLAILAVQGPDAINKAIQALELPVSLRSLKSFHFIEHQDSMIARTGYTGEDGIEILVPNDKVQAVWKSLRKAGVEPCGLGARDSLRLEAGFNLYGSDMDEGTTPLESNLAWTVSWSDSERDFIGKKALQKQLETGVKRQLVGLLMEERGVMRSKQKVFVVDNGEGEITSGGFSPTLGHSIALARIPIKDKSELEIDYRGKRIPVLKIKPPFVRQGQKAF